MTKLSFSTNIVLFMNVPPAILVHIMSDTKHFCETSSEHSSSYMETEQAETLGNTF